MGTIIDGNEVAKKYREKLRADIASLGEKGVTPGLAVILVGENEASKIYVRRKGKACERLGVYFERHDMPEETPQDELLNLIKKLNGRDNIHGILVQLPLPGHINGKAVMAAISPEKDVDAFHEQNVGAIMLGDYRFLPGTPAGVIELIKYTGVEISGANCVVLGRSNIVGKPMAMMLLHENGTVTICHSKTKNLPDICRQADILVCAIGRPKFVTADMIKPGAVVIDVGINKQDNGDICGDVDFDSCKDTAGYITPVPGGVGPMTITMLMQNTVTAATASMTTNGK